MAPIERKLTSLPDGAQQTLLLSALLREAADRIPPGSPTAAEAALSLRSLAEELLPPPCVCPELSAMDEAICEALRQLPLLLRHADAPEVRQTLKTLRRMLLSDRRRVDPDPERHALSIAIVLRQAWLITHRAGVLEALAAQQENRMLLSALSPDDPRIPALRDRLRLLAEYLSAQQGYGQSVRSELEALQSRRNQ